MSSHPNIRFLAWFNFCSDFRIYSPIAILYFAQVTGSYALGMSIYSVTMLSQSLFEVPTGIFSDLIGRRRTIICGAAANVLSLIFYALGGTWTILLLGGICEGLSRAFFSGNNDALLYDTLAESGRTDAYQEYLGKTSAMFQFGLALSALLGGFIATLSFQWVMWVSVIPMLAALLISFGFREPRTHIAPHTNVYAHLRTALRLIMRNPRLRQISLASVLSFAIGESAWLFRSAFVEKLWPVWALGLSQLLGNAGAAIGFYFAGRIIRRFGELRLLVGGMTLSELVNLFGLLMPTAASPALMSMNSIFYGINTTAISGLLQRDFSAEQRATMGSLNSFAGSLVFALFSFLLGALADQFGVIPALLCATVLFALPIMLYWRGLR